MVGKSSIELIKYASEFIAKTKGFDSVLRNVTIKKIADGDCIAEFKVLNEHTNRSGGLHGGFTATLVDTITTTALLGKNGMFGVTVNLNINYLKGALEGDEVIVEGKTIRCGKNLAFLECQLRHKDGSIIANGSHVKFVRQQTKS